MIKNPVIPYAIIAVLGIVAIVIISFVGDNQRKAIENPDGDGESVELAAPDEIYANKCSSCHGDDLSGASGPDLTQVGDRLSEDEIDEIIVNGSENGNMPAGLTSIEEAEVLAEWLSEEMN